MANGARRVCLGAQVGDVHTLEVGWVGDEKGEDGVDEAFGEGSRQSQLFEVDPAQSLDVHGDERSHTCEGLDATWKLL